MKPFEMVCLSMSVWLSETLRKGLQLNSRNGMEDWCNRVCRQRVFARLLADTLMSMLRQYLVMTLGPSPDVAGCQKVASGGPFRRAEARQEEYMYLERVQRRCSCWYVLKTCLAADACRMVLETVTAYLCLKTYSKVDANKLSTSLSSVLDPQVRRRSEQQEDYGYQTFKHHQDRPAIIRETQTHHDNTILHAGEMYRSLEKRYRAWEDT